LRGGLAQFWRTDRGLTALLTSLVAVVFVMPTLMTRGETPSFLVHVGFQVFLTLIFISGVSASAPNRAVLVVAGVVVGAAIALFWVHHLVPGPRTGASRAAVGTLACVLLVVLVARRVLAEGPITFHRIRGAVAVYLLLGLAWANLYELIEQLSPGAFHLPEPPASHDELVGSLGYYSFVTLTTMGYGDILPVHPAARSAAVLEALVGQLFPAILIARLVAMELTARDRDRASK
jgi:hypothetical protein